MSELIAEPDPTVALFIVGGALVTLALGLTFGLMTANLALFGDSKLKLTHLPYFLVGGSIAAYFFYYGIPALTADHSALQISGDELVMGEQRVPLDETTEIIHGGDVPELPAEDKTGYFAMPDGVAFPPRFTGGPIVVVKTGGRQLSFQPIVYGPGRYVDQGQPAAQALVEKLVTYGDKGNARKWLVNAFPPVETDPSPPASKWFYIIFFIFTIPIVGFALAIFFVGLRKKLGS